MGGWGRDGDGDAGGKLSSWLAAWAFTLCPWLNEHFFNQDFISRIRGYDDPPYLVLPHTITAFP
jgi:hypothetical protein